MYSFKNYEFDYLPNVIKIKRIKVYYRIGGRSRKIMCATILRYKNQPIQGSVRLGHNKILGIVLKVVLKIQPFLNIYYVQIYAEAWTD